MAYLWIRCASLFRLVGFGISKALIFISILSGSLLLTDAAMPGAIIANSVNSSRPIPMVTIACATCASLADLQAQALAYFTKWYGKTPPGFPSTLPPPNSNVLLQILPDGTYILPYPGTMAVVSSAKYPISGNFRFTISRSLVYTATPISTTTDLSTMTFDGRAFARAAAVPPVNIPPGFSSGDTSEVVATEALQLTLVAVGPPKLDWWHTLQNMGLVAYYNVYDAQNKQTYQISVGDTITVKYSDGSTEKFQFFGPEAGTIQWTRVNGSYRDSHGHIPNKTPPAPPISGVSITIPYNTFIPSDPGIIFSTPFPDTTLPSGTATVGDPLPVNQVFFDFNSSEWFGSCC